VRPAVVCDCEQLAAHQLGDGARGVPLVASAPRGDGHEGRPSFAFIGVQVRGDACGNAQRRRRRSRTRHGAEPFESRAD